MSAFLTLFTEFGKGVANYVVEGEENAAHNEYVTNMITDFSLAQDIDDTTAGIYADIDAKQKALDDAKHNKKITEYGSLAAVGIVVLVAVLSMKRS